MENPIQDVILLDRTFENKLTLSSDNVKFFYSQIKNFLLSYAKVNSRVSKSCDSFRINKKLIAKISIVGKILKLNLALDFSKYENSKYNVVYTGDKAAYVEVPVLLKVKSSRALKYALELLTAVLDEQNVAIKKDPVFVDYAAKYPFIPNARLKSGKYGRNNDEDDEFDVPTEATVQPTEEPAEQPTEETAEEQPAQAEETQAEQVEEKVEEAAEEKEPEQAEEAEQPAEEKAEQTEQPAENTEENKNEEEQKTEDKPEEKKEESEDKKEELLASERDKLIAQIEQEREKIKEQREKAKEEEERERREREEAQEGTEDDMYAYVTDAKSALAVTEPIVMYYSAVIDKDSQIDFYYSQMVLNDKLMGMLVPNQYFDVADKSQRVETLNDIALDMVKAAIEDRKAALGVDEGLIQEEFEENKENEEFSIHDYAFGQQKILDKAGRSKVSMLFSGRNLVYAQGVRDLIEKIGEQGDSIILTLDFNYLSVLGQQGIKAVHMLREAGIRVMLYRTEQGPWASFVDIEADYVAFDVRRYFQKDRAQRLLASMIDYCHTMNIKTVGTFVDDKNMYDFAVSQGLDLFFGEYISRPMRTIGAAERMVVEKE